MNGPGLWHAGRTLAHLTGYELRRHLGSARFAGSTLLLLLLGSLVVWVEIADHRLRQTQLEDAQARHRETLATTTVYSYLRPRVFRPPEPLAVFEGGVMSNLGNEVEISVFEIPRRARGRTRGNPYLAAAVGLDLTSVLKLVLGLEALLLTYDAVAQQRGRRRLEALLAHGATLSTVWLSRLLAAWTAIGLSLTITLGCCLFLLLQAGHLVWSPALWVPLLGLSLVYGLYGAVMASIGLAIAARATDRGRSLAYALLVWLSLVIFWPQGVAALGEAWSKGQPETLAVERRLATLDSQLNAQIHTLWDRDPLRTEWNGYRAPYKIDEWDFRILRRFGAAEYHDSAARHYLDEVRLGQRFALAKDAIREAEDAVHRRSAAWVETLSLISPGFLVDRLAAELAGTSPETHDAFLAAARAYRHQMIDAFETHGIFGSWRWFTDDPPTGMSWTRFIGVAPEEVTADNVATLRDRFRSEAVQALTATEITRREQHETLDLSLLPSFQWSRGVDTQHGSEALTGLATRPRASRLLPGLSLLLAELLLASAFAGWIRPAFDPRRLVGSASLGRSAARVAPTVDGAELRELLTDVRWRWLASVIVVAALVASWVAVLEHRAMTAQGRLAAAEDPLAVSNPTLRHLVEETHPLQRPTHPLGLFDGTDRKLAPGYIVSLNPWQLSRPADGGPGNPRLPEAGFFDLTFVLAVLLPLAALLLSYDGLSARSLERFEWMSLGRSRRRLLWTQWSIRCLGLALPLALGLGVALAGLGLQGLPRWNSETLFKSLGFVLAALASIGLFTLVGLLVSAALGGGSRSLVALVFLWIVAVSLIPSTAEILARRMVPLPTLQQLDQELVLIRRKIDAMRSASDWRPLAWAQADDFAVERRSASIQQLRIDRQRARQTAYFDQQLAQARFARQLALLSPAVLLTDLGQRLVGGGPDRHREFLRQAAAYRQDLDTTLRRLDLADPESPHVALFPNYISQNPVAPEALPRFRFRELSWHHGVTRSSPLLGLVALLLATLWLLLEWALDRRLQNWPDLEVER